MTGTERVRFCSECSLNVYNLSAMTRGEAESFIASREGRICAKFYRREDGTIITRDCPVGQKIKLRRRISKAATATFAAILSMCASAIAQDSSQTGARGSGQTAARTQKENARGISGKVVDMNGAALPGIRVEVFDASGKLKESVVTNDEGEFQFPSLEAGTYKVKAEGGEAFISLTVTHVEVSADKLARLDMTLEFKNATVLVGVIGVSRDVSITQGTTTITLPN